jgi:catechol 2,3-dioxygenase-like lactoylglutathione lyase family enzyme
MPEVIGVHHAALTVSDLERSIAFYERFGFEVERRVANAGPEAERVTQVPDARLAIALLTLGSFRLELIEYTPSGSQERRRNNDLGSAHICLQVRDIDATYERLCSEGITFNSQPQKHPSGASLAYFKDLDGITVELLEVRDKARTDYGS